MGGVILKFQDSESYPVIKMDVYEKIKGKSLDKIREKLDRQIGRSDYFAQEGEYEKAYEELREVMDECREEFQEEKELYFE